MRQAPKGQRGTICTETNGISHFADSGLRHPESIGAESGYYVCGDGFSAADGVDTFVGLGLQVNRLGGDAEGLRKRFAHFREMRAELRFFRDHNSIDVFNGQVFLIQELSRVLQEHKAAGALPPGIGIGEMCADIAERRSAKERVAQRVRENVAIRMPDWTFIERKCDPADNQRTASRKTVQIVANAAADFSHEKGSRLSLKCTNQKPIPEGLQLPASAQS